MEKNKPKTKTYYLNQEVRVGNNVFSFSPFAWVYPGATVSPIAILVMLIITAVLTSLGLACFSRRDIVTS
ncbi:MAG: hypothetical protein FWF62_03610 [Candidatus Bathyarchaeota archaeon]|nr:hypothetical protein [Candidatus Termiticorpusculum sp.]